MISFICDTCRTGCICSLFFQAEDCIRYGHVTGVQTCALPILTNTKNGKNVEAVVADGGPSNKLGEISLRSEERRVGKECRSRGTPYKKKKKMYDDMGTDCARALVKRRKERNIIGIVI